MDSLKVVITGSNYQEKRKIVSDLYEKLLKQYCPMIFSVNEYLDFWKQPPSFSGLHGDNLFENNIKREDTLNSEILNLCLKPERIILSINGLLDFKSYIYGHLYEKVLNSNKLTDIDLMDRYDIVIFNKDSNLEDNQSKQLNNWIGHENLVVLENNLSLKQKEDIILSKIIECMNFDVDKDKPGIDISDYDISYYEQNAVTVDKEIKRFREFRNDDVSDVKIKRTINGNSSYHYREIRDHKSRYDMPRSKDFYEDDKYSKHRLLYIKNLKEIFFYENGTLYKIEITEDKTNLYILSGKNKMPEHLVLKETLAPKAPHKKLLVIKREFKK